MSNTISAALQIDEKYAEKIVDQIAEWVSKDEVSTISDVMIRVIQVIKEEEFGTGEIEPSEYEKKLIFAGHLLDAGIKKGSIQKADPGDLLRLSTFIGEAIKSSILKAAEKSEGEEKPKTKKKKKKKKDE